MRWRAGGWRLRGSERERGAIRRLWIRVPLGNSDIFLNKISSKYMIINNIYVRASIYLTLITSRIIRHLHYLHYRLAVKMSYIEIHPTFSHLSPNSSMVRASNRRSEGCGFESRLGTQIFF